MPANDNPRPPDDSSLIAGKTWLGRKVMLFIAYHTPRCREVVRILSQEMERELPLSMRMKLWLHNLMCCWCQRYRDQLHCIRKTARAFPERVGASSSDVLSAQAKRRLKQALSREVE